MIGTHHRNSQPGPRTWVQDMACLQQSRLCRTPHSTSVTDVNKNGPNQGSTTHVQESITLPTPLLMSHSWSASNGSSKINVHTNIFVYVILYYTTSNHIISYHVVSCYIILCSIVWYHRVLVLCVCMLCIYCSALKVYCTISYDIMLYHVTLYEVTFQYITL